MASKDFESKHKAYDLHELKIMIVDDNSHMRMLIRQILHAYGINDICEAEDGASALKVLLNFEADIAICDWNMKPFDGIEFTQTVRTSTDTKNPLLPIVMLTGHTETHRVEEARDAGVDEFLSKPVSPASLYSRIVSVIEKRREFVKTKNFFGPDRRRHRKGTWSAKDGRRHPEEAVGQAETL